MTGCNRYRKWINRRCWRRLSQVEPSDIHRVFYSHVSDAHGLYRASSLKQYAEHVGSRSRGSSASGHLPVRHPEEAQLSDHVDRSALGNGPHGYLLLDLRYVSGGVGVTSLRSADDVEDALEKSRGRHAEQQLLQVREEIGLHRAQARRAFQVGFLTRFAMLFMAFLIVKLENL